MLSHGATARTLPIAAHGHGRRARPSGAETAELHELHRLRALAKRQQAEIRAIRASATRKPPIRVAEIPERVKSVRRVQWNSTGR